MPVTQSLPARRRNWEKHVRAWRSSGLPQERYAKQNGIHPRTFYDWCRKVAPGCPPPPAEVPGLPGAPSRRGSIPSSPEVQFVPVPARVLTSGPEQPRGRVEKLTIRIGQRIRISVGEGISSSLLARVVRVLEGIR